MDSIQSTVKAYILEEFLQGTNASELTNSTPLVSGGILDSLATIRLVSYLEQHFGMSQAIEVSTDSVWVRAAQQALRDEFGKPAVLVGSGGSIPVVENFSRMLGMDSLLVGFGLDDDQVHSPNEKFEMRCFERGLASHVRLLARLAEARR